jgi:hypothetical protein
MGQVGSTNALPKLLLPASNLSDDLLATSLRHSQGLISEEFPVGKVAIEVSYLAVEVIKGIISEGLSSQATVGNLQPLYINAQGLKRCFKRCQSASKGYAPVSTQAKQPKRLRKQCPIRAHQAERIASSLGIRTASFAIGYNQTNVRHIADFRLNDLAGVQNLYGHPGVGNSDAGYIFPISPMIPNYPQ